MRELDTREAYLIYLPSGTRLEADSLALEEAVWWHQVGCWRLEPVKQKVRRHTGGSGDKSVNSEEASLQRLSGGPPCSPPLYHPVAERQLASMGWLASRGPLEGHWCYMLVGLPLPPPLKPHAHSPRSHSKPSISLRPRQNYAI